MRTATCFTPDRAFFAPAVRAIASLIEAEPDVEREIFLICEPDDVLPGFDKLPAPLRERITAHDPRLLALRRQPRRQRPLFARGVPPPVSRRHPARSFRADRHRRFRHADRPPGLSSGSKASISADKPLAAAYDMIFLMDFKGDALARQFQRSRRALGLALDTPYFNAGLMAIDRAAWRAEKLTERVTKALRDDPKRYPFMEQDALNATLKGNFAPLSPRFNFMGDFFLLDLERRLEPIVLHFVNAPKPWELGSWRGEARFAEAYRAWFAASPWPDLAQSPATAAMAADPAAAHASETRFRRAIVGVPR